MVHLKALLGTSFIDKLLYISLADASFVNSKLSVPASLTFRLQCTCIDDEIEMVSVTLLAVRLAASDTSWGAAGSCAFKLCCDAGVCIIVVEMVEVNSLSVRGGLVGFFCCHWQVFRLLCFFAWCQNHAVFNG